MAIPVSSISPESVADARPIPDAATVIPPTSATAVSPEIARVRLADAMYAVLLATSANGRVEGEPAGRLRAASRCLSQSQRLAVYWELLSECASWPAGAFGTDLRAGIAAQAARRDAIRIAAFEPGPLRTRVLRLGMWLRHACHSIAAGARPLGALGEVGDAIGHGLRATAARGLEKVRARAFVRQGARDECPELAALLEEVGLDIRHLAAGLGQGIPQPPQLESFWAPAPRGPVVGSVIGLDFIHTALGWTLIETNLGVGRRGIRHSLTTPPSLPERLVSAAAAWSRRHLIVMNNDDRLEPELRDAYQRAGRVSGVEVQVFEELATVGSTFPSSFRNPPDVPDDALIVLIRGHPTTFPFLVSDKVGSHLVLAQRDNCPDYATVPLLWDPQTVLSEHERFPNVICKLPGLDATKGIALLKVRSLSEIPELLRTGFGRGALKAHLVGALERFAASLAAITQPYLPALLDSHDCLSLARTYVLITPEDAVYLGGNVSWSATPVPASLPWGLVLDKRPFVVNGGIPGTRMTGIPEEWEGALQRATIAVGHAFRQRLRTLVVWNPRSAV